MKKIQLKTISELTLSQQANLVAGAGQAGNCNCGTCSCTKEQGSSQKQDIVKWAGPAKRNNP